MSIQTLPSSDTYDVFLAYSLLERPTAELVERAIEEGGMRTLSRADFDVAEDWQDKLWYALAESDAVIVILDPARSLPANTAIEIGAAIARDKPLYVVFAHSESNYAGSETVKPIVPQVLKKVPSYSVATLDDLVYSIKRDLKPLTEKDRADLIAVYTELESPTDQLLQEPEAMDALAGKFKKRSGRHISGDRLVQELIRLRKSGKLPRLRR